ncbi:IPT/TIG domain-containing protein [Pontibacter korlensis]|uniref:IPT/TIG domain-containing protein n=1 Tax=Pontibacter korlensis TaxID=400092 RepID=A0A0E3UYA2_9BACT|nr:IPT/TIG domain-containing protein [Pontibacter korlensis]AKD04962.1 hypothetical protein PKOR_20040 [Pontibacter korlensis]
MRTALLLFFFTFLFTINTQAQADLEQEYTRTKLKGLTLQDPMDFDIAPDGKIYVVDFFNVKVFNSEGELLKELFLDDNFAGFGIATDNQGHFFLSKGGNKVCKYTTDGELVMCFGSSGKEPGQFNSPRGIDLDAMGNIYVADADNYRVQKFDSQGNILQVYDSLETSSDNYLEPYQVKIDANNSLNIVGVHWFKRIKQDGTPELLIDGAFIQDVAFDPKNNIYLTAAPAWQDGHYITKYSHNGDTLGTYLIEGSEEGMLSGSDTRLSTDPDNNLWVMEFTSRSLKGRIHKLSPDLDIILTFGNAGADNKSKVSISHPMRFDGAGNHYSHENGKLSLFDNNGNHIRTFGGTGELDFFPYLIKDFAFDSQGALFVIADDEKGIVHKFTPTGEYVTSLLKQPLLSEGSNFFPSTILLDHSDNIYLIQNNRCLKFNSSGKLISDFVFAIDGYTSPIYNICIDALGFFYFVEDHHVMKYDQAGAMVMQFEATTPSTKHPSGHATIAVDGLGFIYVADRIEDKLIIKKYSQSGKLIALISNKYKLEGNPSLFDLKVSKDGSTIWVALKGYSHFNNILVYQNNDAPPVPNRITGTIYADSNLNCAQDEGEEGLEDILVMATPGPYFGRTNSYGQFTLPVPPGEYSVKQIVPEQSGKHIRQVCPSGEGSYTVELSGTAGASTSVLFANQVTLSPHLSVSVSSTRRRRCFESTTTVHYVNSGFATAPDAKVYVQLPAEVELLSADKAYTRLPDGTYEFKVGDLANGQQGTITIQDIVTCGDESVRGRTVCTRAWITPSNNAPAQPTPTITITGRCDPNSGRIRFVIKNSGTADMEQHELFGKFRDGRLASKEQFRLAAGDSIVLWVPSMGYTWRLEAHQPEGNGDNKTASVTIEACTDANAGATVSSGLVNLMPTDDEEAEVSKECLMITDSFDPNDKLVTPVGRTDENYTPFNTALKYKIRFQNTGTDVAYRVVVVDTLSEHLDLSTLQVGAASHAHRFEVSGKGRPVLTWTFDNIMLPDSTSNEPGSHGYIQFSIKPKADLHEKTAVENFADIFFDYNSPVRTNVTVNRIYDMPAVVDEAVRVNLEDVLATPAIAAFEPAVGKVGTEVIITGKRFATNAAANNVYLNGKAATVVSATASELRVLVPAGATTGALQVVTPDGGVTTTATFEVYQPPVLSSFSPGEGMVGNIVNLHGQHLQPELIEAVTLGEIDCEIVHHSGDIVSVKVPSGAVTGTFAIRTKGGQVESASSYTVWYKPVISSLSKESGIVGDIFTITGENFTADKDRLKVLFALVQAPVLEASPQRLVVQVPEQAESNRLIVETPGGPAFAQFEVIPGPRFTAMQPAQGSVGTVVEICGQHFGVMGLQDKIAFNGQEALVLDTSGNKYKVRVPRGATTGKVQITGYGGKAYSTADFVVEELTPAEAIQVYPNPNSGRFTLSLLHADFDVQSVEIFDGIGRLIHTTTVHSPQPQKLELQIRSAKPGLYTLHIKTERGMITKKITVL